ncbi:hypothetical protein RJ640_017425 [Escallonia rubra]|uniref:UBN2 domain-containing protein n=1 Tax=Escallonia rubra TaxID=112253 RepID=A0AA88RJT1_9ASTE|nr:hypothetical protein RJ640_017425 [Escallonia rubra]
MWRLLEVTHESTNQVPETNINMLVQLYEAFKMKENESINEMYSRFTLIINVLKLLGKVYPKIEMLKNKSTRTSSDTKEKKFQSKKALLTWDDSDESDKEMSENDDVAQMCFMAKDGHSNEVIPSVKIFDYDKLEIAFLKLSENHEKLKLKNDALKKKALSFINTVEELTNENEELDEKIEFYTNKKHFFEKRFDCFS